ncbi:holo-ACP synthase [Gordonia shandongensis]|uniref:holo-ACP synthase AcpS n=1 Tax=Gordonia shandongensis TaxID=376351 RepID=UPI0003F873CC|nr:holo-ACP synthase [Gordonia shandongensis]
MSIVGIGIDLVTISEFADQLGRPGTTLPARFTVGERRDSAERTGDDARHLAARWAAREAVIKAWSSSRFGLPPLLPESAVNDVEVLSDAHGRPRIRLHGEIADALAGCRIHVSLTHDGDTAGAVAVIED